MQKIMFNDRYGLTDAVIDYIKNNTRRIEGGEQFQRAATSAEDFTYEEATGCFDAPPNPHHRNQVRAVVYRGGSEGMGKGCMHPLGASKNACWSIGSVSPPVRPRLRRLSNISKRGRNDTSKILYQIQRLR